MQLVERIPVKATIAFAAGLLVEAEGLLWPGIRQTRRPKR